MYFDSRSGAYIHISMNHFQSLTHYDGIKEELKYFCTKSLQQSFNSQDYKESSEREAEKTNYKRRKCTRTDDEHSNFRRN